VNERFRQYARQKSEAAEAAYLLPFTTVEDHAVSFPVEPIGCPFTTSLLDGPFFESRAQAGSAPLLNLVFVQSRSGNTEADDPSTLGGGETDKHVIYEGLSRVTADAVLGGASTVRHGNVIFSLWHPRIVRLRESLGKPRHPTQVIATRSGSLPIEDGLLFNVPEVPVVIIAPGSAAAGLARRTRGRRWISIVESGDPPGLRACLERLRRDFAIQRISAVGGRTLATSLIEASLVTDLYLTTSAQEGGRRGTPMYAGRTPRRRDLVVRKRAQDGTTFEHFRYAPRSGETGASAAEDSGGECLGRWFSASAGVCAIMPVRILPRTVPPPA
jgi:riboflavin biosynthesis pyrimidine reductase